MLGEAAVAGEDVALDEVVGSPLPEGRGLLLYALKLDLLGNEGHPVR